MALSSRISVTRRRLSSSPRTRTGSMRPISNRTFAPSISSRLRSWRTSWITERSSSTGRAHGAPLLGRQLVDMALQESQVPLDGGERRAQFVGGVGDETALGLRSAFQGCEHLVKGLDNLRQFVTSSRVRYAVAQIAQARA